MTPPLPSRTTEQRADDHQILRRYYNESVEYLQDLLEHDEWYHQPFLELVSRYVPRGAVVFDLGCGPGISTQLLQAMGYRAFGGDLSALFLRTARLRAPKIRWVAADALALPLDAGSVDAVVSFEFIEHVTDVPQTLQECIRILRPGGWLILHSPNLCSPFFPLADMLSLLRGGPGRPVFAESLGQAMRWFTTCLWVSTTKYWRPRPQFLYRKPKPSEHIGGDADSAYLACQIDLHRYLRRNHMIVYQQCHAQSRTSQWIAKLLPSYAPFIGLVAQRPE